MLDGNGIPCCNDKKEALKQGMPKCVLLKNKEIASNSIALKFFDKQTPINKTKQTIINRTKQTPLKK
jgi:hypothetical protein